MDALAVKDVLGVKNGKLKIVDAFTANATENVTISNVAPAAVGTATISKWLEIQDSSGTAYYIPLWT